MSSSSASCTETTKKQRRCGVAVTFLPGTPGHLHGGNVIGARSNIDVFHTPRLECQDDSSATWEAMSAAWVNVLRFDTPVEDGADGRTWAQAGYARYRQEGSNVEKWEVYLEVRDGRYKNRINLDRKPKTLSAGPHLFDLSLNATTGVWSFHIDGTLEMQQAQTYWKGLWNAGEYGDEIAYSGETLRKNDTLVGSSTDKVEFDNCQYKVNGLGWQTAQLFATGENAALKLKSLVTNEHSPFFKIQGLPAVPSHTDDFKIYDTRN